MMRELDVVSALKKDSVLPPAQKKPVDYRWVVTLCNIPSLKFWYGLLTLKGVAGRHWLLFKYVSHRTCKRVAYLLQEEEPKGNAREVSVRVCHQAEHETTDIGYGSRPVPSILPRIGWIGIRSLCKHFFRLFWFWLVGIIAILWNFCERWIPAVYKREKLKVYEFIDFAHG